MIGTSHSGKSQILDIIRGPAAGSAVSTVRHVVSAVDTLSRGYPGATASAKEIICLAEEYRGAAQALLHNGRKGEPISRVPSRLCAIHAIELYLNAFLLCSGEKPERVRARQHDLSARTKLALNYGLILRRKTAEHLVKITDDREYLVARYGPEMASTLSEMNRLMATLEEVAKKVVKAFADRSPT